MRTPYESALDLLRLLEEQNAITPAEARLIRSVVCHREVGTITESAREKTNVRQHRSPDAREVFYQTALLEGIAARLDAQPRKDIGTPSEYLGHGTIQGEEP